MLGTLQAPQYHIEVVLNDPSARCSCPRVARQITAIDPACLYHGEGTR